MGTLRYRDEDGGESEGRAGWERTLQSRHACGQLSAGKQDRELLNVELIYKQESLVEVMEGLWTMILLPGPLLH